MKTKLLIGLASAAAATTALAAAPTDASPGNVTALGAVESRGKAVFDQWCRGCHGPLPGVARYPPAGTYKLAARYNNTLPATLEDRTDLSRDFISTAVRRGLPIMPPARKTEITDADLDALVRYLTRSRP